MKLYTTLFILFFSLTTLACDMCGGFMGLTPYDNQSQLTLLHRYRVFNGYRSYQQRSAFFIPGAYKTQHHPGSTANDSLVEIKNYSSKDYETFKVLELRGKYFLHPRLEINFIAPIQQIKTKYDGVKSTNTGIADPSVFVGYHLIKRLSDYNIRQRLILGVGIKLPMGDDRVKNNQQQRFFLLTQNGTGSWDHFYYLNYIISRNRFGLNLNSMVKFNGINGFGERLGNSFNQTLNLFAKIETKKLRIFPSVLANYEFSRGVFVNDQLLPNTNMNLWMLGPSVDVIYKSFVVNACYQMNAYERVSSQTLGASGRFIVGITWNFNQVKYLINS